MAPRARRNSGSRAPAALLALPEEAWDGVIGDSGMTLPTLEAMFDAVGTALPAARTSAGDSLGGYALYHQNDGTGNPRLLRYQSARHEQTASSDEQVFADTDIDPASTSTNRSRCPPIRHLVAICGTPEKLHSVNSHTSELIRSVNNLKSLVLDIPHSAQYQTLPTDLLHMASISTVVLTGAHSTDPKQFSVGIPTASSKRSRRGSTETARRHHVFVGSLSDYGSLPSDSSPDVHLVEAAIAAIYDPLQGETGHSCTVVGVQNAFSSTISDAEATFRIMAESALSSVISAGPADLRQSELCLSADAREMFLGQHLGFQSLEDFEGTEADAELKKGQASSQRARQELGLYYD